MKHFGVDFYSRGFASISGSLFMFLFVCRFYPPYPDAQKDRRVFTGQLI